MTRFSNTYAMSHVKNTNTLKVMFFRYFAYYSRDVTCEKHVKMWNGVIFRHFTFHEHVKCVIFRYFALFTWCQVWKARVHMKGHDFQILHIMHAMSREKYMNTWIDVIFRHFTYSYYITWKNTNTLNDVIFLRHFTYYSHGHVWKTHENVKLFDFQTF